MSICASVSGCCIEPRDCDPDPDPDDVERCIEAGTGTDAVRGGWYCIPRGDGCPGACPPYADDAW